MFKFRRNHAKTSAEIQAADAKQILQELNFSSFSAPFLTYVHADDCM